MDLCQLHVCHIVITCNYAGDRVAAHYCCTKTAFNVGDTNKMVVLYTSQVSDKNVHDLLKRS